MSRSPRRPRLALVVATLLTAALAVASCSAGALTQTGTAVSQAAGAWGRVGTIVIQDAAIEAGPAETVPPNVEVPVRGTIVNESLAGDRLMSVTSPFALGYRIEGVTAIPGKGALRMVGAETAPVGPSSFPASQPASARVVLTGVTEQLRAAPTYAVTFTFERAGSVTLPLIVVGSGPS